MEIPVATIVLEKLDVYYRNLLDGLHEDNIYIYYDYKRRIHDVMSFMWGESFFLEQWYECMSNTQFLTPRNGFDANTNFKMNLDCIKIVFQDMYEKLIDFLKNVTYNENIFYYIDNAYNLGCILYDANSTDVDSITKYSNLSRIYSKAIDFCRKQENNLHKQKNSSPDIVNHKGKVISWNIEKGYGFIIDESDMQLFCHCTNIIDGNMLKINDIVTYNIVDGKSGKKAINIKGGINNSSRVQHRARSPDRNRERKYRSRSISPPPSRRYRSRSPIRSAHNTYSTYSTYRKR